MLDIRSVISAAVLALGTYISPASADGMPKGPARDRFPCCGDVEYREYNWSGIFVGGHIAGAISHSDFFLTTPTDGFRHNETSFGGGVQGAAQYQWGRLVAGVETSFTWIDFDASSPSIVVPGTTFSSNVSDLLIVAGKLGYAQDRWLAFAKAGYASAEFAVRTTTGGVTTSSSDREHGWTMGLGIDYAVTDRVIIGVEYDWSFFDLDTRNLAGQRVGGDNDIQIVAARLMFKFGRD